VPVTSEKLLRQIKRQRGILRQLSNESISVNRKRKLLVSNKGRTFLSSILPGLITEVSAGGGGGETESESEEEEEEEGNNFPDQMRAE